MKLTEITKINYRKLFFYRTKSLYLILPIVTLVILGIIVTSQIQNIKTATDKSFFGTVAEKSRLIELSKDGGLQMARGGSVTMRFDSSDSNFNENDLAAIEAIEGVETASINASVPVTNVKTSDLFEGKTLTISSLTGIDSALAGLYTDDEFSYTEGESIPIILNANTFVETYEDWGDKTEITMELGRPGNGGGAQDLMAKSPIKTQAIDYNKEDLIGTEFELTVGGLDSIQTYEQNFSGTGITFTKKTAEEIAAEEATRAADISTYWNYDQIKTPLKYKFVVVGVIEDESNFDSYIPSEFADKLMKDYISNQITARTSTEIATELLDNTFTGIKFDGVEFSTQFAGLGGFRAVRMVGGPGGAISAEDSEEESVSYAIPGLIIKTEREETSSNSLFGPSGDAEGVHLDSDVYTKVQRTGTKILIKTSDIYSRSNVVLALNEEGYAYQDLFKSEVFSDLQKNLNLASLGITALFIGVSALVVMFTMGKFVSESTKEIGVLRSIGAKRSDIRNMFVSQAILYTIVAYIIGSILGFILNLVISGGVYNWFDGSIGDSLRESFDVVVKIDKSIFTNFNVRAFGIYSMILLVIALIISLIPALKASRMSPVTAIKGE